MTFVDDYAHLPPEVAAALIATAGAAGPGQSPSFSRTGTRGLKLLAMAFADAFTDADLVIVTAIDAAGGGATSRAVPAHLVLDAITGAHP